MTLKEQIEAEAEKTFIDSNWVGAGESEKQAFIKGAEFVESILQSEREREAIKIESLENQLEYTFTKIKELERDLEILNNIITRR